MIPHFLWKVKKFIAESLDLDEKGQTLVEYGLILFLVVVGVISILTLLRGTVTGLWQNILADMP